MMRLTVLPFVAGCLVAMLGILTLPWAVPEAAEQHSTTQQLLEERYGVKWPESELLALSVDRAVEKHGGSVATTLAQIHVETSYNPRISAAGAIGYMQVRPKFWKNSKDCPYNVYDRYENVFLGVCILQLYKLQFGNEDDALIAYNVGPSAVETFTAGVRYRNKVLAEAKELK